MHKLLTYVLAGILGGTAPAAATELRIANCTQQSRYFAIFDSQDFVCVVPRYLGSAGTVNACETRTFTCEGGSCKVDDGSGSFTCAYGFGFAIGRNHIYTNRGRLINNLSETLWDDYCECPRVDFPDDILEH